MPFTVLCTACDSRFLLGDDLFRRKVSGNAVMVRCRRCDAEISLDARDIDTLPSQELPQRRAPHPPRPKAKTELTATVEPAATPLQPISEAEAHETWDSDLTVSLAGKAASSDAEFVDFEEVPASSSDAPALEALTHRAEAVPPPRPKKQPDDFLVKLSAGTGGILGAPGIDTASWVEPAPPSLEVVELEPELDTQRAGSVPLGKATVPLFDMSAVLPAAHESGQPSNSGSARIPVEIDFGPAQRSAPASASNARVRKFVVAPQAEPETQKKRGGVLLWLAVAAGAAAVVAIVGVRARHAPERAIAQAVPEVTAVEPSINAAAPVEPVEPIEPAAPAAAAPSAADVPSVAASPSAAPTLAAVAPTSTPKSALPPNVERVATPSREPAPTGAPSAPPTSTTEPAAPTTPVAIHNAPPPAAPGTEFDRAAALSALQGAAQQASACRKEGDPSGTAVLTITFAPSGRVTSAAIQGPPFAGTPTGGCIASTMRRASIPAFDGERVTVTKTVVIE